MLSSDMFEHFGWTNNRTDFNLCFDT